MKKHLLLVTALLICFFSAFSQGPSITSVDPSSGLPGTVVTITGTNLGQAAAVSFGGTPARSFTIISDTSVSAVVGAGSSGAVEVSAPEGTASLPGFTFVTPSLTLVKVSDGSEDGRAVQFEVRYPDGYVPADVTSVGYQLSGTAIPGTDFPPVSGTIQIPAGAQSALIELTPADDRVMEGTEEIAVSLVSADAGDDPVSFDSQATVSAAITDNDTGTALSVAVQAGGAEPGTDISFRISFPAGVTSSVPTQVSYQVGGSATPGADYAALSGTLILPAGENAADLVVPVADDAAFEGPETVTITLQNASNAVASVSLQTEAAEATIADNEEDPADRILTLSLVSDGEEGGGDVRFRVSFPAGVTRTSETIVSYTVGGTAVPGTDHQGSSGTVRVPADAGSADIVIPVTDDLIIEAEETITVTLTEALSDGTELGVDPDGPVTARLTDNDNTPMRNRISVAAVANGAEPATNGRFEVRFPPGVTSSDATTVNYQVAGDAAGGTDYTALPGSVVIPAGANSASITVSVLDDEQFEGDETVQLTLVSASGLSNPTVANQPATLTITENDDDPATNVITLTAAGNGAEGGNSARFRFSYPAGVVKTFNTTVSYAVSGTAAAGADYAALPGSLVIPSGQNFAELSIPLLDDQVIEPAETLVLSLESASVPAGVTTVVTVGQDPVTAQVTDNDTTPMRNRISVAAVANGAEPATNGRFEVRFPPGITSSEATTVNYQVAGDAAGGTDYTALPGSVVIPAG
ncbi:MAG TPA: Calx-beta domain-containing protein, partial [Sphingobacteriaceae bacterium]